MIAPAVRIEEPIEPDRNTVNESVGQRGIERCPRHASRSELLFPRGGDRTRNRQVAATAAAGVVEPGAVAVVVVGREVMLVRDIVISLHANNMEVKEGNTVGALNVAKHSI